MYSERQGVAWRSGRRKAAKLRQRGKKGGLRGGELSQERKALKIKMCVCM